MCVIETTEVTIRPFDAVDARLDYDEGEGDRSHVSWRDGHWVSFARVCTRIGRSVDETSEMKTLFGCIRQEVDYIPVNGRVTLGLPE
jgi:uncharacterized protein YhfF